MKTIFQSCCSNSQVVIEFTPLTAPRLICGRVYQHLKQKMSFLWTKDLRINTVHVTDVSRACWHTATTFNGTTAIFNLADENDTGECELEQHQRTDSESHATLLADPNIIYDLSSVCFSSKKTKKLSILTLEPSLELRLDIKELPCLCWPVYVFP